jgi:hypothetical protein
MLQYFGLIMQLCCHTTKCNEVSNAILIFLGDFSIKKIPDFLKFFYKDKNKQLYKIIH